MSAQSKEVPQNRKWSQCFFKRKFPVNFPDSLLKKNPGTEKNPGNIDIAISSIPEICSGIQRIYNRTSTIRKIQMLTNRVDWAFSSVSVTYALHSNQLETDSFWSQLETNCLFCGKHFTVDLCMCGWWMCLRWLGYSLTELLLDWV